MATRWYAQSALTDFDLRARTCQYDGGGVIPVNLVPRDIKFGASKGALYWENDPCCTYNANVRRVLTKSFFVQYWNGNCNSELNKWTTVTKFHRIHQGNMMHSASAPSPQFWDRYRKFQFFANWKTEEKTDEKFPHFSHVLEDMDSGSMGVHWLSENPLGHRWPDDVKTRLVLGATHSLRLFMRISYPSLSRGYSPLLFGSLPATTYRAEMVKPENLGIWVRAIKGPKFAEVNIPNGVEKKSLGNVQ